MTGQTQNKGEGISTAFRRPVVAKPIAGGGRKMTTYLSYFTLGSRGTNNMQFIQHAVR